MPNLLQASRELFSRLPDERHATFDSLSAFCHEQKRRSTDRWHAQRTVAAMVEGHVLNLRAGTDGVFALNDWSFGQLCRLSGIAKETVNRLTPTTASLVLQETLPRGNRPLQLLEHEGVIRAIHGASYTRLYSADLLDTVAEFTGDFQPPPVGFNGATGLYAGEQDMFCFLIDADGWIDIGGQAFAPGFFLWNSEVGRRSVGLSTFWYQRVCGNHIVWDATEVVEFTRKHTAKVDTALVEIRGMIAALIERRDQRQDAFARITEAAMRTVLGEDREEALKALTQAGFSRELSSRAIQLAGTDRLTVFSAVDALTRLSQDLSYAGDRTDLDQRASSLLGLAV